MTDHDKLAADLLEKAGSYAGDLAKVFGERGALAGTAVKAITFAAAQAIRHRGVTVDELVQSLRKVGKLETPWPEKIVGKDPA